MEFIETNNVILVLVLVVLAICFISSVRTQKKEAFSDYIDLEKFNDQSQLNKIEDGVGDIRKDLSEYQKDQQDMSKFALKSQVKPPALCKVNEAIDKDNYISKAAASKDSCPVPVDYDSSKYILKSVAQKPQSCPSCPTLDYSKYVLKSTLPVDRKCAACICPKVKVSAGLCRKCPKPNPCPAVTPCPQVNCPAPKACPPQRECAACPAKEACPPKICPPCDAIPSTTPCPKCCDRDVVKILRKEIYVDQNGNPIKSNEVLNDGVAQGGYTSAYTAPNAKVSNSPVAQNMVRATNPATNSAANSALPTPFGPSSSDVDSETTPTKSLNDNQAINSWMASLVGTQGSGLTTPAPTLSSNDTGSNSLSGSLEDQSNANNDDTQTGFPASTESPIVQNYDVAQEKATQKKCKGNPFNHEFKQFGVYGRGQNNNTAEF